MCLYSHMKLDERSGVRHYSCCICRLPTLSKYFILKHVASHVKSAKSQSSETGEDYCADNCRGGNSSWYGQVSSYVWPVFRIGSCPLLEGQYNYVTLYTCLIMWPELGINSASVPLVNEKESLRAML